MAPPSACRPANRATQSSRARSLARAIRVGSSAAFWLAGGARGWRGVAAAKRNCLPETQALPAVIYRTLSSLEATRRAQCERRSRANSRRRLSSSLQPVGTFERLSDRATERPGKQSRGRSGHFRSRAGSAAAATAAGRTQREPTGPAWRLIDGRGRANGAKKLIAARESGGQAGRDSTRLDSTGPTRSDGADYRPASVGFKAGGRSLASLTVRNRSSRESSVAGRWLLAPSDCAPLEIECELLFRIQFLYTRTRTAQRDSAERILSLARSAARPLGRSQPTLITIQMSESERASETTGRSLTSGLAEIHFRRHYGEKI